MCDGTPFAYCSIAVLAIVPSSWEGVFGGRPGRTPSTILLVRRGWNPDTICVHIQIN